MAYCYMKIGKINSFSGRAGMSAIYAHNYRLYDVANADMAMAHLNHEVVSLKSKQTYKDAFYENIKDYEDYGKETFVRKNAILGFDVMLTYSGDVSIDIEAWEEANVNWLKETFNKEVTLSDGKKVIIDNIKSVVTHLDEQTPHIHAFVIPRDDKGNLNGSYYIDKKDKLRYLQTDYARAMKDFGLERGKERSVAKHTRIKRFYDSINKAFDEQLPLPDKAESIEEYHSRANKYYTDYKLAAYNEHLKLERKLIEEQSINQQSDVKKQTFDSLASEIGSGYDLDEYASIMYSDVSMIETMKRAIKENPNDMDLRKTVEDFNRIVKVQHDMELARYAKEETKDEVDFEPKR